MDSNSYPTWLSQVRKITQSPASEEAFADLESVATPKEVAIAEQKVIATEMACQGSQVNMSGRISNPNPTLLQRLGFTQVSRMNGGVYHVKSNPTDGTAPAEYIALWYSPAPITLETTCLQLFMLPVPDPMSVDVFPLQIQTHWQSLDARRLEESGLEPLTVSLPFGTQLDKLHAIEYARPGEAWRVRHCVQLLTGDVVCYN